MYYDFTCSAPNLVSILAVTFDDPRLVEPHERAARMAIEEMERFAGTRVRKAGGSGDRVVREMEERLGLRLSNEEVSHVMHHTREKQLAGLSTEEVQRYQLGQVDAGEVERMRTLIRGTVPKGIVTQSESAALDHAKRHVFERRSVVPEHEVLEAALVQGQGEMDLGELRRQLQEMPGLLRTERGLSTVPILREELEILQAVREGKHSMSPLVPGFVPAVWLGVDQKRALLHVLANTDRITGIRGLAGSGKTSALRELDRALKEAGYHVEFCAPTSAAVEVLRQEGFAAVTLARLLEGGRLVGGLRSVTPAQPVGGPGTQGLRRGRGGGAADAHAGLMRTSDQPENVVPRA